MPHCRSSRPVVAASAGALFLTGLFLGLPALAAVPEGPPRVSPMATVSQVVGVSEVSITYSRPSVKERDIWGDLVPYDKLWRTGANEATTFTLSDDAKVAGKALSAGSYAMFTVPGEGKWKVVFNKKADQWGTYGHDAAEDALTIEVEPAAAGHQESLLISFPAVSADSTTVSIRWEKLEASFDVAFDVPQTALAKARAMAKAPSPENAPHLFNYARHFVGEGTHAEEALGWAGKIAKMMPAYRTQALYSRLLAQTGDHAKAIAVATEALASAKADSSQRGVAQDSERLATELAEWKKAAGNQ